jgi:putative transposase
MLFLISTPHQVFVTKYRRKVLNQKILDDMKSIFEKISTEHQVILKEFNGEEDHVHMLIHYPPKVSLAKLVNSLKGVSSRRLRQNWPELEKRYYQGVLWSPSYFAAHAAERRLKSFANTLKRRRHPLKALKEDAHSILSMNGEVLMR